MLGSSISYQGYIAKVAICSSYMEFLLTRAINYAQKLRGQSNTRMLISADGGSEYNWEKYLGCDSDVKFT
jgi:hypothetical protein